MSASASRRPRPWLARHCDLAILLLLVLASIPPVWLSPRAVVVVRDTSLIDDNWHLDEIYKLSRGIWVGRDVAFTHGPIFQWLSSLPGRSMGVAMGPLYATWVTVPAWCAFLFVYLTLRLLLPEQPAWKRALLLFLVLVFWEPSLRNAFPVLLFAVFLRGWYAVIDARLKAHALGILAALLLVTAFLVASDTGVYSTAAWGAATVAVLFEARGEKNIAGKGFLTLLAFAVSAFILAVAANAVLARAFDFRFWKESAHMVSVYRWATPAAMTDAGTIRLLGTSSPERRYFYSGGREQQGPCRRDRAHRLPAGRLCLRPRDAAERAGALGLRPRGDRVVCYGAAGRHDSVLVCIATAFVDLGSAGDCLLDAVLPSGLPALHGHPSGAADPKPFDRVPGRFPGVRSRLLCPGIYCDAAGGGQLPRPAQPAAGKYRRSFRTRRSSASWRGAMLPEA